MTPDAYLESLPAERRAVVSAVRDVIRKNLPAGYTESVSNGMLTYCVAPDRLPKAYAKVPVWYAALAAKKNYYSLHLLSVYADKNRLAWLERAFKDAGKKLDIGKACVRFKSVEELPLDAIGELIAAVPVEKWIAAFEASRRKR